MAASSPERRLLGREPLRPERVRIIDRQGFAFIPNNFLRGGFFASLEPDEQRLYLLLVLASDRRGMSFYHYDSICTLLEVQLEDYLAARDGLIKKDLIAFDGTRIQVLSLPPAPTRAVEDEAPRDPVSAEIRSSILASLRSPIR